ncbi:MAG TPA: DHHW family protein [Microvirga sp.]|jgi:hypothetical protein
MRQRWLVVIIGICATFVGLWLLPLVSPPIVLNENRVLAEFPSLSTAVRNWRRFARQVTDATQDQLPFRAPLIAYLNYARYSLGYSASPDVHVGQNGWLFFNAPKNYALLRGTVMPIPEDLDEWAKGLQERVNLVRKNGAELVILVGPDKQTIYPHLLPRGIAPAAMTGTDLFYSAARARAGFEPMIDVRSLLAEKAKAEPVYHALDTHWTSLGAYYAYTALMEALGTQPLPRTSFREQITSRGNDNKDLANMLGIGSLTSMNSMVLRPTARPSRRSDTLPSGERVIHTGASGGRTLYVVHDSFGHALMPFLESHFSRIVTSSLDKEFPSDESFKTHRPDIVLMIAVERNLSLRMPRLQRTGASS